MMLPRYFSLFLLILFALFRQAYAYELTTHTYLTWHTYLTSDITKDLGFSPVIGVDNDESLGGIDKGIGTYYFDFSSYR